jgi:hypothetical protein
MAQNVSASSSRLYDLWGYCMTDPAPRYRCSACQRAALNGTAARCLYCGASLPPEASRPASQVPERARAPAQTESSMPGTIDTGLDVVEIIVDGMDAISGLLD